MENVISIINYISSIIIALCGVAVAYINLKKDAKGSIPKKIKGQVTVDSSITNKMENLKEYLNADRVQVYDFHNGGHYANGRSALKTSCSYEVVRTGIKGHQKELQAVPLSCIPHFVEKLLNNNILKINDLEELKDSMPATYELKKSQDVASFFDVILNNKNGEPIGFLAIQYERKNCVNFTEEEI